MNKMNYNETKEYLKRYLKARIPVITINTVEKNRIIRLLKELQEELTLEFNLYNMSDGLVSLKSNVAVSEEKTIMGVLDYIANDIKTKQNCNYILSDISDINDSTIISRYLVDVIQKAESASGVIIIISSEPIWNNIQRLGIGLKFAYPTESELKDMIVNTIKPYQNQITIEWDDKDYSNAATYLQGLSEMEAKNIITSLIVRGNITKEDLKELKYTKQKLMKLLVWKLLK